MEIIYDLINNTSHTTNNIITNDYEQSANINNITLNNRKLNDDLYCSSYLQYILDYNITITNKVKKIKEKTSKKTDIKSDNKSNNKSNTKTDNKTDNKSNIKSNTKIDNKNDTKTTNKPINEHNIQNTQQLNLNILKSYTTLDNFAIIFIDDNTSFHKIINNDNNTLTVFFINIQDSIMYSNNMPIVKYNEYITNNNIHSFIHYDSIGALKINDILALLPILNINLYNDKGKRKLKSTLVQDILNFYEKKLNLIGLEYN
jgi:hypothetical protein